MSDTSQAGNETNEPAQRPGGRIKEHDPLCPFPAHKVNAPHGYCDDCCETWECRCEFIGTIRLDEQAKGEHVDDAQFHRGVDHGLSEALSMLAERATVAELSCDSAVAEALLAAAGTLSAQIAAPADPKFAVTLDAEALEHAAGLLRRELEAGYWAGDDDTERDVNAILEAWGRAFPQRGNRATAIMRLSLWVLASDLLGGGDEGALEVRSTIERPLALFARNS